MYQYLHSLHGQDVDKYISDLHRRSSFVCTSTTPHCHLRRESTCAMPISYRSVDRPVYRTTYVNAEIQNQHYKKGIAIFENSSANLFTLMPSLIELNGINFKLCLYSPLLLSCNDSMANWRLFKAMRASPSQISANHFIEDSSTATL